MSSASDCAGLVCEVRCNEVCPCRIRHHTFGSRFVVGCSSKRVQSQDLPVASGRCFKLNGENANV